MTTDSYKAVVGDLLRMYPPDGGSWSFADGYQDVWALAHGWLMRTIRSTQAALILSELGYRVEAAPLRRTAMDHMTALLWLASEGDAVANVVVRLNANQATRRLQEVDKADWKHVPRDSFYEAISDGERVGRDDIELDEHISFVNRNEKYGSSQYMPVWVTESQHSHPCWTSAEPYVDGGVALPEPKPSRIDDAYAAASFVVGDALVAMNKMLEGHPMTGDLRELIRRFYEVDTAARALKGLPRPPEYDDPILPEYP